MKNKKKYKITEPNETTDGFWYDISDGGYIRPKDMLVDQERVEKLTEAIELLRSWEQELIDDEALIVY